MERVDGEGRAKRGEEKEEGEGRLESRTLQLCVVGEIVPLGLLAAEWVCASSADLGTGTLSVQPSGSHQSFRDACLQRHRA